MAMNLNTIEKIAVAVLVAVVLIWGAGKMSILRLVPRYSGNGISVAHVSPNVSPASSPKKQPSVAWTISLPDSELNWTSDDAPSVILHSFSEESSIVSRYDLGSKEEKVLYEIKRDNDGADRRYELIDLSDDGNKIAYTENGELLEYNLLTQEVKKLLYRVGVGESYLDGAKWNNKTIVGIGGWYNPEWSPDGRYIAFRGGAYEATPHAIYDTVLGTYNRINLLGGSAYKWMEDSSGLIMAVQQLGMMQDPGLFIVPVRDVTRKPDNLLGEWGGAISVDATSDGELLVVLVDGRSQGSINGYHAFYMVALMDKSGRLVDVLYDLTDGGERFSYDSITLSPFFSPDYSEVYFALDIDGYSTLFRHTIGEFGVDSVAILPKLSDLTATWTSGGELLLIGTDETSEVFRSRLFGLDIEERKLVFASSPDKKIVQILRVE